MISPRSHPIPSQADCHHPPHPSSPTAADPPTNASPAASDCLIPPPKGGHHTLHTVKAPHTFFGNHVHDGVLVTPPVYVDVLAAGGQGEIVDPEPPLAGSGGVQ